MTTLTNEQQLKLEKAEKAKKNNRLRQQRYRDKSKATNAEGFKTDNAEYMRAYRKKIKVEINTIQGIVNKAEEKVKPINIKEISNAPVLNKKDKRHAKKKNISTDIIPSHSTRTKSLEQSTINEYLIKLNILHKHFTSTPLNAKLKSEISKMLNDNDFVEDYIITNMNYLQKIEDTIQSLRQKYPKDNSFKSYLNPLTVVLSHLPSLNINYQIITKVAKNINMNVQVERSDNILPKRDEIKIIDLDKKIILDNINNIINIQEKLIFSLYTLFPARREDDYRLMRITFNIKADTADDNNNYLQILKNGNMNYIFNQYKTRNKYGQQIYKVPDDIIKILNSYISQNGMKEMDYLFYSNDNKKDKVGQGNFSTKISNVFKKVYTIPISIRYLRKSHATYLNEVAYKNKWSTTDIKEYQTKMSHSDNESSLYRVVGFV